MTDEYCSGEGNFQVWTIKTITQQRSGFPLRFSPLRRSVTIPWGKVTITSSRLWVNPAVRHLDRKGIKLSCLGTKTRLSNPNGIKDAAARNTQIARYLQTLPVLLILHVSKLSSFMVEPEKTDTRLIISTKTQINYQTILYTIIIKWCGKESL